MLDADARKITVSLLLHAHIPARLRRSEREHFWL